MFRYLLTTLMVLSLSASLFAQEAVTLTFAYRPESVYTMEMTNRILGTMDVEVPDSLRQALGGNLDGFPMEMEMENHIPSTMTTGKRTPKGSFPVHLAYGEIRSSSAMNGEAMESEDNPLSGISVYGTFTNGRSFTLDSLSVEQPNPILEQTMKGILDQMERFMVMPEKPIAVGEDFTAEVPMEFPMAGMQPIEMKIRMTYTLTALRDGRAYFDLDQRVEALTNQQQFRMRVEGVGTGTGVFQVKNGYWESIRSQIPMEVEILMEGGIRFISQMDTQSTVITTLKPAQ